MTRKKKCNSKSNSFVALAEQVCLQPVLEHRQRQGRRNIAGQAIPHLCSSNRKGTTSDSWPTTGRNVKLFNGGGPEPASVRHVGDTCEWRRQVRWRGTMQCTICCHLEYNLLQHTEPIKADERVGDVVTTSQVKNGPCFGILDWLETLDVSEASRSGDCWLQRKCRVLLSGAAYYISVQWLINTVGKKFVQKSLPVPQCTSIHCTETGCILQELKKANNAMVLVQLQLLLIPEGTF